MVITARLALKTVYLEADKPFIKPLNKMDVLVPMSWSIH